MCPMPAMGDEIMAPILQVVIHFAANFEKFTLIYN